jgi:transposase
VLPIKKTQNHPKADPEKRSIFCQEIQKLKDEGKTIVYVDESGFAQDMARTHGYSLKGKRCYGVHDWGLKGRTNAIGALIGQALLTVVLLSGNVDTEVFSTWIKTDLLPKLPPTSTIVLDNASFHKGVEMKSFIEKSGHKLLYLPPYSPDLNPIEKKWAHAKHLRRSLGCSIDELFQQFLPRSFYDALAITKVCKVVSNCL